jgi:hypothetical protein
MTDSLPEICVVFLKPGSLFLFEVECMLFCVSSATFIFANGFKQRFLKLMIFIDFAEDFLLGFPTTEFETFSSETKFEIFNEKEDWSGL